MTTKVYITGIGLVTPLGYGWQETWEGMCAGRSGVDTIRSFDPTGLASRVAGELPEGLEKRFRDACRLPLPNRYARFTQAALLAASYAIEDGALDREQVDKLRAGVSVGVGAGSFHYLIPVDEALRQSGKPLEAALDHNYVVKFMPNAATAQISMWLGWQGPGANLSVACATGAQSIALAMEWIRSGRADLVLAGGSDATVSRYAMHSYSQINALSTRNEEPQRASRPFDVDRDGFVMAEGAGVLLLESEQHARARGARVYASLVGQAYTSEAYNVVMPKPDGEGVARTMSLAMADAGIRPEQVDYVSAHGTSTPLNDPNESKGIRLALGTHADKVPVSSQKSMMGHAIGATSAIEAGITALSVHQGMITPTINLDQPDPECDLDYVPNLARKAEIRYAISNAFGFGGHNCVLVLGREDQTQV